MSDPSNKFFCEGCEHQMTWKQEYAGRRIKCKKCGQSMVIPAQPFEPEPASEDDELYALSDLVSDAHAAAANLPPTIVEAVAAPVAAAATANSSRNAIPLAYRQAATPADVARAASQSHIDPKRDLYVPVALLLIGTVFYIGYYAIHYNLGGAAIFATSIGLTIMTVFETALLFGFALVIAGPLGVSFGGIGTALLKLAAIIVFCDGVAVWVDGLFSKYAGSMGGGGLLSFGVIGLPVALAIYWTLLIYLFSMDAGDSWMVVVIITVFYRILRLVLMLMLLKMILSFGGVGASAIALPSMGGSGPVNPVIDEINNAKAQNVLHEARKYAADNSRSTKSASINGWYDAGTPNVWFQCNRDIDGKGNAFRMVVELPDDKTIRTKCYDIAKKYYNDNGLPFAAQSLQDKGDPYLLVPLP